MLTNFIKNIVEGSNYIGLEIFDINGIEHYSILKICKQKNQLEVTYKETFKTLEEAVQQLDKKTPLFLTINNAKIVKKKVISNRQQDAVSLLAGSFPNLDVTNFYYQTVSKLNTGFVSLGKKEYIEEHLKKLNGLDITVFSVMLGPTQLTTLGKYLKGPIMGSNFTLEFEKGAIVKYSNEVSLENRTYLINGIEISKNHLLSFAHILSYILNTKTNSNLNEINSYYSNILKNSRLFDVGLKFMFGFFLLLLLTNFLGYSYYNQQNVELTNQLADNSMQTNALAALKKRIASKEDKLKILTDTQNSKTSFYCDKIGKSIPNSISLTKMNYQPLKKPVRKNKNIETQINNLQIFGVTQKKEAFTHWINQLEQLVWVRKVEILSYEYISDNSLNFTLNLTLHAIEQKK
jgi:Tfp pilus assembly protein PilN